MKAVALVGIVLSLACSPIAAQPSTSGSLSGVVLSGDAGLPGVTVTASGPGGTRTTVTGQSGEFRFPLLPVGKYAVTAELSGFAMKTEHVDVQLGRAVSLRIRLDPVGPPPTGTVAGIVSARNGAVISGAKLVFIPVSGGDRPEAESGSDGRYTRDYLKVLTYDVECSRNGYRSVTKRVSVIENRVARLDFRLSTE